jgi:uncharacterized protein YyaL (SSP411 family)
MPNRLQHETSPYLQQHAGNPVDWYPWGAEALERSRAEDKPILLSIGYSACHWCHVMAHESFEDASVADVMNRNFVNVKVDREERPDLDQIYQAAHQMLTRRAGGWPLTMFLTPRQVPFFGGTYFPRESRYSLPGFVHVMERVAQAYREMRREIDEQGSLIKAALARTDEAEPADLADAGMALLDQAIAGLRQRFDPEHGGFGGAPKFPHPTDIELCLRQFARDGDRDVLHVALHTLRSMAQGGIYDQLGGGFCRYSVDRSWTIPHFEKMLYDNAQLLPLYADAWAITRDALFERAAVETAAWVMREMQSPQGGYYSSLDADSEGAEGKFYVWDAAQVRALLGGREYSVVAAHYGLDGPPNFHDEHAAGAHGARGLWHLAVAKPLAEAAAAAGVAQEAASSVLDQARAKLLAARELRVRPGRDEKILTSWNALMIAGMARAAFVFGREDWAQSARSACRFLCERMMSGGRLFATFKDGRAHLDAYLDDYAYFLKALLSLIELSLEPGDLVLAQRLADTLLTQFEDEARGGFFFTAHDHEQLIHRSKSGHDNATPAGNGVAAQALARLAHLTGDMRYLDSARRAANAFGGSIAEQPVVFGAMLMALEELLAPPTAVVLRGDVRQFESWRRAFAMAYHPTALFLATDAVPSELPAPLALPSPASGVHAFVCRGTTCLAPVDRIDGLLSTLAAQG